jgi:hypothetical protein
MNEITFGSPNRFAIKFSSEAPFITSDWYFISVSVGGFWCGGDEIVHREDFLHSLSRVREFAGRRSVDAVQDWVALYSSLVDSVMSDVIVVGQLEEPRRFYLWMHHCIGEYHIFFVAIGSVGKLMLGRLKENHPFIEVDVESTEIEAVLKSAFDFLAHED